MARWRTSPHRPRSRQDLHRSGHHACPGRRLPGRCGRSPVAPRQHRRRPHPRGRPRAQAAAPGPPPRPGHPIRTDTAGGTHAFFDWLTRPGRRLFYSVGMTITDDIHAAIDAVPARAWASAYDTGGQVREGVGRRDHRHGRHELLVEGNAADRAQGAPPSRGAAAHHRRRRPPPHLLRDQRPDRAARRPGAAPPPAGPG